MDKRLPVCSEKGVTESLDIMHSNKESVATKLKRIVIKARKDPACKFTSLFHLMNHDLLWRCFWDLRKSKASGIDQVTKEQYDENVTDNLDDKLIPTGLSRILQVIYEQKFIDDSYGVRQNRGCHDALRTLNQTDNQTVKNADQTIAYTLVWPESRLFYC